jgi:hypothetical protein
VVAESSVQGLVALLKSEIGAGRTQMMMPQAHGPAEEAEAEVDFGEFTAVIAGVVMKLFVFCLRLSHSGKAVQSPTPTRPQESFLDGHVRAFEALSWVPAGMIRYDKPQARGDPGLAGPGTVRASTLHRDAVPLRLYDSFFCAPGIEGTHEKAASRARSAGSAASTSPPFPVPPVASLAALKPDSGRRRNPRRVTAAALTEVDINALLLRECGRVSARWPRDPRRAALSAEILSVAAGMAIRSARPVRPYRPAGSSRSESTGWFAARSGGA